MYSVTVLGSGACMLCGATRSYLGCTFFTSQALFVTSALERHIGCRHHGISSCYSPHASLTWQDNQQHWLDAQTWYMVCRGALEVHRLPLSSLIGQPAFSNSTFRQTDLRSALHRLQATKSKLRHKLKPQHKAGQQVVKLLQVSWSMLFSCHTLPCRVTNAAVLSMLCLAFDTYCWNCSFGFAVYCLD